MSTLSPLPGGFAVEVAHVRARTERIAFAGRDDHPHRVVGTGLFQRGQILAEQCPSQAVALLRPVEPADLHGAVSLDHEFAHRGTPAQRSSGNLPALTVDCSSTYSDRPSEPNSRPMPDCLNPPKGQLVSSVYMLMP